MGTIPLKQTYYCVHAYIRMYIMYVHVHFYIKVTSTVISYSVHHNVIWHDFESKATYTYIM